MNNDNIDYLNSLKERHRNLDTLIQERFKAYAPNEEMARLKTQKLWLKDEIQRLEETVSEQRL